MFTWCLQEAIKKSQAEVFETPDVEESSTNIEAVYEVCVCIIRHVQIKKTFTKIAEKESESIDRTNLATEKSYKHFQNKRFVGGEGWQMIY